jgi:hypothetical protein
MKQAKRERSQFFFGEPRHKAPTWMQTPERQARALETKALRKRKRRELAREEAIKLALEHRAAGRLHPERFKNALPGDREIDFQYYKEIFHVADLI